MLVNIAQAVEKPCIDLERWIDKFSSLQKWLISHQHYLYYPVMLLARWNLYVQGFLLLLNPSVKIEVRAQHILTVVVVSRAQELRKITHVCEFLQICLRPRARCFCIMICVRVSMCVSLLTGVLCSGDCLSLEP